MGTVGRSNNTYIPTCSSAEPDVWFTLDPYLLSYLLVDKIQGCEHKTWACLLQRDRFHTSTCRPIYWKANKPTFSNTRYMIAHRLVFELLAH